MLKECRTPLCEAYDVAMLDLDGVVYVGSEAVPGAPEHLDRAAAAGMHLAYVTNNASRPPAVVAEHLRELGVPVADGDVVNSAQAAARVLAEQLPPGSVVFVIGGAGLFEALTELDLKPVQSIEEEPVAVVSGYHPELLWRTVIDGAILVKRGLPWVASNMDLTVPTQHGLGPGNGVLVNAVAAYAGRRPTVAGKPLPPLFAETHRRVGGERPLVVGDRLDTDIEGARAAGFDSLLVMTGVTRLAELVAASPPLRPSYVAADLSGLSLAHDLPRPAVDGTFELDGWRSSIHDDNLQMAGDGPPDAWWAVVAATAWQHLDATGGALGVAGLRPPGSVGPDITQNITQHTEQDTDQNTSTNTVENGTGRDAGGEQQEGKGQ